MNDRVRLVTFDLDDTLWEVDPVIRRADNRMRAWLGRHAPRLSAQVDDQRMGAIRHDILAANPDLAHDLTALRIAVLRSALERAGYRPAAARRMAQQAFDVFFTARNEVTWFDDVAPVLSRLRASGLVLGGLSNGNADFERTGLARYFAFHVSAADVGRGKPAPDMFHAAMAQAGVSADQMVHVGDSVEHDVAGAVAARVRAVWLNRSGARATLPDGVLQIRSLHELSPLLD